MGTSRIFGTVQQVDCCRRRFLGKGLKYHVCTINKSAHTKKVWKLIVCTSYFGLFSCLYFLSQCLRLLFVAINVFCYRPLSFFLLLSLHITYLHLLSSLFIDVTPTYSLFFNGITTTPVQQTGKTSPTVALDMTLNCIWWWESCPGVLGNVEYSFIAITHRSSLARTGNTYWSPVYQLNRIIIFTNPSVRAGYKVYF